MPKLSSTIKFTALTSPIEQPCQANPQHLMRPYIKVQVLSPHYMLSTGVADEEAAPAIVSLNVCPVCFVEFLSDTQKTLGELQKLGT